MKNTNKSENVSLFRLIKAMRRVKLPLVLIIASFAVGLLDPIANIFLANAMGDLIDASGNVSNLVLFSLVGLYLFYAVLSPSATLISGVAEEKLSRNLRGMLWRKLIRIPQSYYDQDGGETLVSRVTTDCDFAGTLLMELLSIVSVLYSMAVYIYTIFQTNVQMATFTMILAPLTAIVGVVYSKLRYLVGRKNQGALADATGYLIERTKDLPLVKTAGTGEEEAQRGKGYFQEQYRANIFGGLLAQLYTLIDNGLRVGGILITFVLGASLVNQGTLTAGDVIAYYQISNSLTLLFANLVMCVGIIRNAVGSMSRVVTTLEVESEDTAAGQELDVPNEDILLKNVTFGYTEDVPVLKDLSCVIPKNKVTALIGANGSGKTTIFKLLERMYTPRQGAVYYGDKSIDTFTLASWRKSLGLVAQDCPILEGTLRSNITYGSDHPISDGELKEVARMANLTALVESLPDGFDSYVAPGGRNFSGGQRQCIAIARAIMHNPDYLLLDEATSALDVRSSRQVAEALGNLMKGRTTIMIAHDLSSIRQADNVIFIRDGKVEICGSPAEIIKTSEQYRRFVTKEGTTSTV